mmetsp:Transcript_29774/g.47933  ORF Transcript_29774/g.47933 Transcript_29774/m.47933 type:complete len:225 (+) Transcript_29774:393-1067(+)
MYLFTFAAAKGMLSCCCQSGAGHRCMSLLGCSQVLHCHGSGGRAEGSPSQSFPSVCGHPYHHRRHTAFLRSYTPNPSAGCQSSCRTTDHPHRKLHCRCRISQIACCHHKSQTAFALAHQRLRTWARNRQVCAVSASEAYASASVQQEESASPCCEQVPLCVAASAHNCAAVAAAAAAAASQRCRCSSEILHRRRWTAVCCSMSAAWWPESAGRPRLHNHRPSSR